MKSEILNLLNNNDCNIGHLLLYSMKQRPDCICQIDAATGEQETFASVLSRTITLARCLRKSGYQVGDVLSMSGPNNLNTHIPHYAAMMNGMPYAGLDPTFKYEEIKQVLSQIQPKISICMKAVYDNYIQAVKELNLSTKVLTLDEGEHSLAKFIEANIDADAKDEDFEPATFDPKKCFAWLASTSGTTGVYKMAAITHRAIIDVTRNVHFIYFKEDESNLKKLMLSPVQWISGLFSVILIPVSGATILQTSAPSTEHIIDIINEYKPVTLMSSCSSMTYILKNEKKCDFTCFNQIALTGGKIYKELLVELKGLIRKDAFVVEAYGQTENLGPVLRPNTILGSCGTPVPAIPLKLVDPETGKEITEANTPGELWTKGSCFTEYYNKPEETAKAFTEDGWYKTGDILYRDQNDNYFFVERFKMLIKYKSYHVYPIELEDLIRTHPGVADVVVTSIEDKFDGEHPVAIVIRQPDSKVTAQEIKDLVANKLSDSKQLRGGVVFVEEFPLTSTGKIAQRQLRTLILNVERE